MSQWFGWTDAISLSAALNVDLAPALSGARVSASSEQAQSDRVRGMLASAVAEDCAALRKGAKDAAIEFAPYRRRHVGRQQAMETSIGALRGRLRATLAARSPAMTRLAAVDGVMEQVIGARERSLLAGVPALLEKHFERLRQADEPEPEGERAWLNAFHQDFQDVLLAELDFRFQPVEGLLAALRTGQPDTHE